MNLRKTNTYKMYEELISKEGGYFRYKTPLTDEDIENILKTAKEVYMFTFYVDGEYVGMEPAGYDGYFIFYKHTGFSVPSKQEAIKALRDLDGAVHKEWDLQDEFAKKQIPKLWKAYKEKGFPKVVTEEGSIYSDLFKDVFGIRPRSEYEIVNKITRAAQQFGIDLE